jgi:membrane-bound lytic murein transglycosylase F|tara:strand:+ start:769 stop:2079 length:1311 start_codon:yes stop_codon:yes gene_type:complete
MMLGKMAMATLIFFIYSCPPVKEYELDKGKAETSKDLDIILKEGKLRVSTTYSETSSFLYRGQALGFEYELLQRFADYLGVEIEIVVANDINNLISNLNFGKVDLIAHGLTITKKRQKLVSFSDYIFLTYQILVQRKPLNWRKMKLHEIDRELIQDVIELDGKIVSVREKTSHMQRLKHLSLEIVGTIKIDRIDVTIATDEIIKMVVDGDITYTIANDHIASIVASYYPQLNVEVPISFSQRVGWVTRLNSPQLFGELNNWLEEFKKESDYYVIYNKYFKNERVFKKRNKSDFYSVNSDVISKYDDIIKSNSIKLDWDWRLTSVLIYQESQFKLGAKSWVGAGGLMQMMPAIAKEMGVKDRFDSADNVTGAPRYLGILWSRFDAIKDAIQRMKFTMAAYNCGYGHVRDAQTLADKKGVDRNIWDENVGKNDLGIES